ncbi:antibiotic biosynthesis monooxygenase [Janibacter anophelis]|uniref:antibiotic biosynthesis monooxygenase n=1 Tax=Janibacter anophelis TaxID=319054 RepID=UPI000DEFC83E|nr:antibiotic biosynthesis monooxygenase [Janibacter anophelis]
MSDGNSSAPVTRIARRRARPGHAAEYEELVREMFGLMREHGGFLGAELIPPETEGGLHQVVVNFASEDDLARWDGSATRREIFGRMRAHAEGEPEHRRLSAIDEWFIGPDVPSSTRVPRWKNAVVTWMGIWPLASLVLYFIAPIWKNLGLPFLLSTAINVVIIVVGMVFLVSPVLTKAMRWFLVPQRR